MADESLLTSLFPGEVVTRALVRDVELPESDQGSGTMALITLDNGRDHTRPNGARSSRSASPASRSSSRPAPT